GSRRLDLTRCPHTHRAARPDVGALVVVPMQPAARREHLDLGPPIHKPLAVVQDLTYVSRVGRYDRDTDLCPAVHVRETDLGRGHFVATQRGHDGPYVRALHLEAAGVRRQEQVEHGGTGVHVVQGYGPVRVAATAYPGLCQAEGDGRVRVADAA